MGGTSVVMRGLCPLHPRDGASSKAPFHSPGFRGKPPKNPLPRIATRPSVAKFILSLVGEGLLGTASRSGARGTLHYKKPGGRISTYNFRLTKLFPIYDSPLPVFQTFIFNFSLFTYFLPFSQNKTIPRWKTRGRSCSIPRFRPSNVRIGPAGSRKRTNSQRP